MGIHLLCQTLLLYALAALVQFNIHHCITLYTIRVFCIAVIHKHIDTIGARFEAIFAIHPRLNSAAHFLFNFGEKK